MREWLGKPLLIVALIVAVLAVASVMYIWSGPTSASAGPPDVSRRQMAYDKAMADFERCR